ncbi:MAG: hypothetical protein ACK5GN_13225, partial [Pseudomonadota bacterium]
MCGLDRPARRRGSKKVSGSFLLRKMAQALPVYLRPPTKPKSNTLSILVLAVMLLAAAPVHAATYYWVGSGGNTNSGSNWRATAPTSGSQCTANGNTSVPGSADDVVFDADCDGNAAIDANLSVTKITTESGYAGTITQNSGVTIATTGDFVFAGGTFLGGNSAIDVNGSFDMTGGSFTSTSGVLSSAVHFKITGGTFTHNSGTVTWDGACSLGFPTPVTFDASGVTFNQVSINKSYTSANGTRAASIVAGTVINLGDNPTLTIVDSSSGGTCALTNNGTLEVGTGTFAANIKGTFTNAGTIRTKTVTKANSYSRTYSNASGSTVEFIGDGDGAVDSSALSDFATSYHHLIINATDGSSDTFTSASPLDINGNLTLTAGTLSAPSQIYLAGDF